MRRESLASRTTKNFSQMFTKILSHSDKAQVSNNTGSCYGVVSYLMHEDMDLLEEGIRQPFFGSSGLVENPMEIVDQIDHNHQKLMKTDSKFFCLVLAPSDAELTYLGEDFNERSEKLRQFTLDAMEAYAAHFGIGLHSADLQWIAKIHRDRQQNSDKIDTHIHVVVGRKSADGKHKLSPLSNHKKASKGIISHGFDRSAFKQCVEDLFDTKFGYRRTVGETYEYARVLAKGTLEQIRNLPDKDALKQLQQPEPHFSASEKQKLTNSKRMSL